MKPLLVLFRIVFIGCLWSIIFTEGIRVIMLENWHFDMFWPLHWVYAWNLWLSGWVIDTPKEWAFVLIIISFIPLWLTGWIALSMVAWERIIAKIVMFPINLFRGNGVTIKPTINKTPVVVKKKSYKEIRPTGHRVPIRDYSDTASSKAPVSPAAKPMAASYTSSAGASANVYGSGGIKERAATARETFSHSLFNLDSEEDDFDLDFDSFEKSDIFKIDEKKVKKKESQKETRPAKRFDDDFDDEDEDFEYQAKARNVKNLRKNKEDRTEKRDDTFEDKRTRQDRADYKSQKESRRKSDDEYNKPSRQEKQQREIANDKQSRPNNPIVEVLTQKGYDVLSGITIKNTIIDFLGVSEDKICLCLVDKETGDWLADEERFNNEEPLWFSENSHRISPVRKASIASDALARKLEDADFDIKVEPYVIVQMGNIINAEDMFETWEDTGVEVTRINRGSPKEIKLFSKTIEEAQAKLEQDDLSRLKKLLKSN